MSAVMRTGTLAAGVSVVSALLKSAMKAGSEKWYMGPRAGRSRSRKNRREPACRGRGERREEVHMMA